MYCRGGDLMPSNHLVCDLLDGELGLCHDPGGARQQVCWLERVGPCANDSPVGSGVRLTRRKIVHGPVGCSGVLRLLSCVQPVWTRGSASVVTCSVGVCVIR